MGENKSDFSGIQQKGAWGNFKRIILLISGTISLGLGILGIFLPLLPTTVFLLIAAYCYARSSEKFYSWLMNNKLFGNYIRNYREKKGITIGTKIISLSFLWLTILYSAIFIVENLVIQIVLILIAVGVSIHLLTIRTYKHEAKKTEE